MAQTSTRRQVLAFGHQRHHLTRRLGQGRLADAAAACGIRNTPPGSAPAALLARAELLADLRGCRAAEVTIG